MVVDIQEIGLERVHTFHRSALSKERLFRLGYSMRMSLFLFAADLICILVTTAVICVLWLNFRNNLYFAPYIEIIPLVLIFPVIYKMSGLYPAIGLSPVYELYKLTISTSVGYLILISFTFWLRNALWYSRAILFLSWLACLLFIPLCRSIIRRLCIHLNLWGVSTAIVGSGKYGQKVFQFLKKNPHLGMKPVLLINGNMDTETQLPDETSTANLLPDKTSLKLTCAKVDVVIIILSETAKELLSTTAIKSLLINRRVITISDIQGLYSYWSIPVDFGGILGLEIPQNLSIHERVLFKYILDIGLLLILIPLWLPVLIACSILVLVGSRGGIFYRHKRIGQNGAPMYIYKFRTMVENADRKLEDIINQEIYQEEWKKNHKLRSDPRITRIGHILRRYSLDELPQIWNIFKGEMSIIGPRPIVTEEVKHYYNCFNYINQVKPGLTGLWQVSGRNDLDYETRVNLDEYYVRNWSIWLDFYILLKTVEASLSGKGAY